MPKGYARLAALFLLATSVRLLYVDTQPRTSHLGSTDAWGYHRLALNLELGNGFSLRRQAPFEPDGVRTPLYPLFLLLVRRTLGPSPRVVAIVQAVLDGIAALLTYRLAIFLASMLEPATHISSQSPPAASSISAAGRRAGRVAALLYALNPVQVRQVNQLLTETLLSCLLLLCLCTLVGYARCRQPTSRTGPRRPCGNAAQLAVVLGLLAALAALCKPNVQYLPLLWLPAILLIPRPRGWHRWRDAALMLAAFVALLAPWTLRNRIVFGRAFLSTAFQGNVSRVSAPAALLTARGEYAIPWSAEWESAFGELVGEAAERHRWDQPWETMDAQARDRADRQVYQIARETLVRHPFAWAVSHLQGTLRHLEPQTYRALYAGWTGKAWPPDVLDDALIHTLRAAARGDWREAGQIITQERWGRLTPLQKGIWWSMMGALLMTCALTAYGASQLRRHPALLLVILGTIAYVLFLPGPIAYERFRVPVLGPTLALAALPFALPSSLCYNRSL